MGQNRAGTRWSERVESHRRNRPDPRYRHQSRGLCVAIRLYPRSSAPGYASIAAHDGGQARVGRSRDRHDRHPSRVLYSIRLGAIGAGRCWFAL